MKIRDSFVSNSSSTSFCITNKSDKELTLVDFVEENLYLINKFNEEYSSNYNNGAALSSAYGRNITFKPHESKILSFGDEDGTIIGAIFDYILREGGSSEHFSWKFEEYLR